MRGPARRLPHAWPLSADGGDGGDRTSFSRRRRTTPRPRSRAGRAPWRPRFLRRPLRAVGRSVRGSCPGSFHSRPRATSPLGRPLPHGQPGSVPRTLLSHPQGPRAARRRSFRTYWIRHGRAPCSAGRQSQLEPGAPATARPTETQPVCQIALLLSVCSLRNLLSPSHECAFNLTPGVRGCCSKPEHHVMGLTERVRSLVFCSK